MAVSKSGGMGFKFWANQVS